jgi:hypothetical protein
MSFDQARSRGSQSWIQDPRFAPNDAPNVPTGWTNVHTGCLGPMVNGSQAQASWAGKQTWQANKLHGKTGRHQVAKAHYSRKQEPRISLLRLSAHALLLSRNTLSHQKYRYVRRTAKSEMIANESCVTRSIVGHSLFARWFVRIKI